jgi:hypothetical protein
LYLGLHQIYICVYICIIKYQFTDAWYDNSFGHELKKIYVSKWLCFVQRKTLFCWYILARNQILIKVQKYPARERQVFFAVLETWFKNILKWKLMKHFWQFFSLALKLFVLRKKVSFLTEIGLSIDVYQATLLDSLSFCYIKLGFNVNFWDVLWTQRVA